MGSKNYKPIEMELKVTSYAGLLDQSGFKQWYRYLKLRVMHGYQMEEVSFLMSKPPFYFRDYEMLEIRSKITNEDQLLLMEIFQGQRMKLMDFNEDDYGSNEKRIIQIRRSESMTAIDYLITIPWTIKGNTGKLKIREEKQLASVKEETETLQKIEHIVCKLLTAGFFRTQRMALEIYRELEEHSQWSPHLRPVYVKQVLYQQISEGTLSLKMNHDQLWFQKSGI